MLIFEGPTENRQGELGSLFKYYYYYYYYYGEHKHSVVGKHIIEKQGQKRVNLGKTFIILKKCSGKLECLICDVMLIIRDKRPMLNTQADSIHDKLFM